MKYDLDHVTFFFQFNVNVTDNSNPEKFDISSVIVTVTRNLQSPVFTNTPYTQTINYNQAINVPMFTATALDGDIAPTVSCRKL